MDAKMDAKFPFFFPIPQKSCKKPPVLANKRLYLVRPMRFERTAFGVGVQRSIQLSYGRGYKWYYTISPAVCKALAGVFCAVYTV